ncbi:MAG: zinc ABC transporter substrate-binding protein, partial [Anaerolineaceae bacterium]|nr:zinc ABC transporter substrate-binding protein [Anaerolineaceae bacterium]
DEDDDHADEHDHEDEDDHHEIAIHEDAEERCAQHDMELGERFLKLQDEAASPGPLYAVDCDAIGGCDPHVWLQPRNIAHWTLTARDILAAHDSAHAEGYFERSEAYLQEIEALEQEELLPLIATLPVELRLLVSHHLSLGYFAGTYGFAELGSVVPGRSTMAEPGVAELAALIDLVRERNLPAVFGETTSSDDLIRQVATETGATLVNLDMESLGEEDGPIGTWIGLMRSNVEAIVNALADEMSE